MRDDALDITRCAEIDVLRVGRITLIVDGYAALVDGRRVSLTLGEYRLLLSLLKNVGRTLSMDRLARLDGELADPPTNRALRARVATLRRKLGAAADQIQNIRGVGYRLVVH